jgi:centromere-localized protein 2
MDGPTNDALLSNVHTERTVLKEMELAIASLEEETAEIDSESNTILAELQSTVGDLSDLRYGKFNKTPGSDEEFGEETLQNIRRVMEVCNQVRYEGAVQ